MQYQSRRFGLAQLSFHIFTLLPLLSLPLGGALADPAQPAGRIVNCDHGGRLAVAVRNARPGDTIRFTGTCKEQVTITTDRLTIDGQESQGIIDGEDATCPDVDSVNPTEKIAGLVEIDAVQGVILQNLTVQNSLCDGIFFRGSSATLRNVTVKDSADDGIDSEQAGITLEESSFTGNHENGMNLSNNSTANVFKDVVSFNDNGRFGVLIHHSLLFVSSDATLEANSNPQTGIGVFAGAELMGYTGSKLTVKHNTIQGLLLINGGMFLSYTEAEIIDNGNAIAPPEAGSAGISLVDSSVFSQTGGDLTITNSAGSAPIGMAADNSTVALRMAANSQAFSISSLSLTFGARATLMGSILNISCDGKDVLIRPSEYTCK